MQFVPLCVAGCQVHGDSVAAAAADPGHAVRRSAAGQGAEVCLTAGRDDGHRDTAARGGGQGQSRESKAAGKYPVHEVSLQHSLCLELCVCVYTSVLHFLPLY